MSRLSFALVLVVGLLAGGLAVALLRPAPAGLDATEVRAMVTDMLDQNKAGAPTATAQLDAATFDRLIEDYLMRDPAILDRMNAKLDAARKVAQRKAEKALLDAHADAIYHGKGDVVLGNPKGNVTLVELFDYNCSFCRGALPDLATLMADDPHLKVILKDFPILTQGSIDAARVAVLVGENPKIDYWDFHRKLFSTRGEVGADQALQVAAELGGNRVELMLDMNGTGPTRVIQANYDLARALNVTGTPTYILGDEMIPGALPLAQLKLKIANLRACGSTLCPAPAAASAG